MTKYPQNKNTYKFKYSMSYITCLKKINKIISLLVVGTAYMKLI